jgi:hypothetical protein
MDIDNKPEQAASQQVAGQEDRPQPGSLSYPGSLQATAGLAETPARGMSYPMPSGSPTSSGSKKHKCPYCNTEFTRHHNLKSHLSTMSGIAYDNGDEELRRQSLPNANAQQMAGHGEGLAPVSRTYPPASRPGSGLYPPNANQAQTSTSPSAPNSMASSHTTTSASSAALSGGGAGMYSQGGVTESPKPLSPGFQGNDASAHARQRSESLSQQLQQSGKRHQDSLSGSQSRPKLPGLSHPGYGSQGSGAFAPGRSGTGSTQAGGESGNMFAQSDPSVWAYIQTMEEKIKSLNDMVVSLDQEVLVLKKQLEGREASTTAATAAAATAAANNPSETSWNKVSWSWRRVLHLCYGVFAFEEQLHLRLLFSLSLSFTGLHGSLAFLHFFGMGIPGRRFTDMGPLFLFLFDSWLVKDHLLKKTAISMLPNDCVSTLHQWLGPFASDSSLPWFVATVPYRLHVSSPENGLPGEATALTKGQTVDIERCFLCLLLLPTGSCWGSLM